MKQKGTFMEYFYGFRPVGYLVVAASCFVTACSWSGISEKEVFTLYRNTPSAPDFRAHVATFDADHFDAELSEVINSNNCSQTVALLQGSKKWEGIKFWCEVGRFNK